MRSNKNVTENKEKMRALGLGQRQFDGQKEKKENKVRLNEDASESDYLSSNDHA